MAIPYEQDATNIAKTNNMKHLTCKILFAAVVLTMAWGCKSGTSSSDIAMAQAARGVLERLIGDRAETLVLEECPQQQGRDTYDIVAADGVLTIKGSSATAMTYAFNRYLREACHGMSTWSGKHINLPDRWPDYRSGQQTSPYALRYFLNVCTYGYTTPYWDWARWEREIDWMALHGINMPLATVAAEAIAERVWLQMGLSKEEARAFFTGAAHLPWHRMGNLVEWDGPLSDGWQKEQIDLQHKIIDRMRALGMKPIAPAFAGFVPVAFAEKHPDTRFTHLKWGGFDEKYNAYVLPPDSPFFKELGRRFIEEWEKEFGKNEYYLSDSFNEMRLPVAKNDTAAKHRLLADYGESIYQSIKAGNPDAVWVTQGWTFGYQHDFWDEPSLRALLSRVPDDKMIIIDLGNDYPKWVWHTEQTWKTHKGFYGKQWIFSYVPNFGGKTGQTGDLSMYASSSAEALQHPDKGNLVGFGSAPEGLENNEVVYELLADMGWTDRPIDLNAWLPAYSTARYGASPEPVTRAWQELWKSAYSNLYSYPRFMWQTIVPDTHRVSRMNVGPMYRQAVKDFLSCRDSLSSSPLYVSDAIELAAFYVGAVADSLYRMAYADKLAGRQAQALEKVACVKRLLIETDRLLASHPLHRLAPWVAFARGGTSDTAEQDRREANAKCLITTWGGWQEDYAARFWSGLIKDYYIPRIEKYFATSAAETDAWEAQWIKTPWKETVQPFDDPLTAAVQAIAHADAEK